MNANRQTLSLLLLASSLLAPALVGQQPASPPTETEEDVVKAALIDPYTGKDAKAMAAAGIVAYGPLPWADHTTTAAIDRVLGENRVLWLETAHFRIGCNLRTVALPEAQEQRKHLYDELKRLKKKLPKIDDKPKKLDPWLRLHLYAQRAEELYAEFLQLIDQTDADFGDGKEVRKGKYLGLPDKFLVLLFQKKSDVARYLDRFCGIKGDTSYRHHHAKTSHMGVVIGLEGMEGMDDFGLQGHFAYSLIHNFLAGYQGFLYELLPWLGEGLAHWYERRVPTTFISLRIKDEEAVDQEKQHEWPRKVRRRAQFDRGWLTAEQLFALRKYEDFGFQAHTMSWSRVDYLMAIDKQKLGMLIRELKNLPVPPGAAVTLDDVAKAQQELLQKLFGLDNATFDERWRAYVLKTYPKK